MTSITKHISFPSVLFSKLESKAKTFGVSIAEYLRHLAMNDINSQNQQTWESSLPTYKATEKKWKEWDEATDDTITMTPKEFKKRKHYV